MMYLRPVVSPQLSVNAHRCFPQREDYQHPVFFSKVDMYGLDLKLGFKQLY